MAHFIIASLFVILSFNILKIRNIILGSCIDELIYLEVKASFGGNNIHARQLGTLSK